MFSRVGTICCAGIFFLFQILTCTRGTQSHSPSILLEPTQKAFSFNGESDYKYYFIKYKKYLSDYDKDVSRLHDFKRLENFALTLKYVRNFASSKPSNDKFSIDVNHMADWHDHEKSLLFSPSPHFGNISENQLVLVKKTSSKSDASEFTKRKLDSSSPYWPTSEPPLEVNWNTNANPKGFPVIPSVRNQGMCGSCWAFVSSAISEASVRINTGAKVPLSVQELIDCDTDYNRGCLGGNPIFAFEYIMNEGLTGWFDYPYREQSGKCMRYQYLPRASIQGYLLVSPMNQPMIKRFLAQGPVAVGMCGTDPSFLFYSGGIYNPSGCCTVLNHAVLLVGYGHDDVLGLDYWTAQNSWGPMWGEKGFIRLHRTNLIGTSGQCGMAVSPSAAIGGYTVNMGVSNDDSTWDGWTQWAQQNTQILTFCAGVLLMTISLSLLVFGWTDSRHPSRPTSPDLAHPFASSSSSHTRGHYVEIGSPGTTTGSPSTIDRLFPLLHRGGSMSTPSIPLPVSLTPLLPQGSTPSHKSTGGSPTTSGGTVHPMERGVEEGTSGVVVGYGAVDFSVVSDTLSL